MSRFGNLEFGPNSGSEHAATTRPAMKEDEHWMGLAQEAFERGQFREALRRFSKVLEFNPALEAAWSGQTRMLIELGEFQEARIWADKALESFPDAAELLAAKAVALARSGDLPGAISFSDAAVEAAAATPYVWLSRADVLLARREKRAEYCFEKAFSLARNHWLVLWLAARIQHVHEHFATALKLAQAALELQPARAVLWLETGRNQLALGLAGPARNSFEQARELDPECEFQACLDQTAETNFLDKVAGRWRQWFGR